MKASISLIKLVKMHIFNKIAYQYNKYIKWLQRYNWNIVESGIKHHKPKTTP